MDPSPDHTYETIGGESENTYESSPLAGSPMYDSVGCASNQSNEVVTPSYEGGGEKQASAGSVLSLNDSVGLPSASEEMVPSDEEKISYRIHRFQTKLLADMKAGEIVVDVGELWRKLDAIISEFKCRKYKKKNQKNALCIASLRNLAKINTK